MGCWGRVMSCAWAASSAYTISMPKPAPSVKNTANWGMGLWAGSVIVADESKQYSSSHDARGVINNF